MKGIRSGSFHIKESKGGEISLKKENTSMKTPGKCSKLSSATHGFGSYNFYAIHTQYIPSVNTPNFRVTLSLCHKTSLRAKSFI